MEIIPVYDPDQYRIYPFSLVQNLPVGEEVEVVPEIRTGSIDSGQEYQVVNDDISYQWSDTQGITITEDTSGSKIKYIIKRTSSEPITLTLTANWGESNTTEQTYHFLSLADDDMDPSDDSDCVHNWVTIEAEEPTENQDGHFEYERCSKCNTVQGGGDSIPEEYIIPALGSKGKYTADEISTVEFIPKSGTPFELLEEDDGYWHNEDSDNAYFEYYFGWTYFNKGDILRVYLKDGTNVNYRYVRAGDSGDDNYFVNMVDSSDKIACPDDNESYFQGTSNTQPLSPDTTYDFKFAYKGHEFLIKVKIISNPVKSLAFRTHDGKPIQILESTHGAYYEDWYGDPYYYYNPIFDGDILTVTYTSGDIVEYQYDSDKGGFYDSDGAWLKGAGHIDNSQYGHPWKAGNVYSFHIGYSGRYTELLPVEIIPVYEDYVARIFPTDLAEDLPCGESIEVTPEVRVGASSTDQGYTVADNVTYEWDYDEDDIELTETESGQYTIKRLTEDMTYLTLIAKRNGEQVADYTYRLEDTWCEHDLIKTEAVAATATKAGNTEYWTCKNCGKYFADEDGEEEIEEGSWIISETGETPSSGGGSVAPSTSPTEPVTKPEAQAALNDTIADAQATNSTEYTAESYQALLDAITNAKAVAADENATIEQLQAANEAVAAAKAGLVKTEIDENTQIIVDGSIFTIATVAGETEGTVIFTQAENSEKIAVPETVTLADGKTYKVTAVAAGAFAGDAIKTVTIGKNVEEIAENAFAESTVKKLIIKSKKLTADAVRDSLVGSSVKTIKVKVGTKKQNIRYIKKYKKIFTKENVGKKVTVK